jgi:polyisoprenoid-binding protein YceI
MMRFLRLTVFSVLTAIAVACGGSLGEQVQTGDAVGISIVTGDISMKVDPSASIIEWIGAKPAYQHNGTINISDGNVVLADGKIVGGKFTIDMNSIKNLDITDKKDNIELVGHLRSSDFFDAANYPTAVFEIKSALPLYGNAQATHSIMGNLTMKNITKSVTFPAMVKFEGEMLTATTPTFVIDRSLWNVRFESKTFFDGLKDKFIHDEISLSIRLIAGI